LKRKIATGAAFAIYVALVVMLIWLANRGGVSLAAISRIGLLAQCIIAACAAPFFAASYETSAVKSALRPLLKTCALIGAGFAGVFFGVWNFSAVRFAAAKQACGAACRLHARRVDVGNGVLRQSGSR